MGVLRALMALLLVTLALAIPAGVALVLFGYIVRGVRGDGTGVVIMLVGGAMALVATGIFPFLFRRYESGDRRRNPRDHRR